MAKLFAARFSDDVAGDLSRDVCACTGETIAKATIRLAAYVDKDPSVAQGRRIIVFGAEVISMHEDGYEVVRALAPNLDKSLRLAREVIVDQQLFGDLDAPTAGF